MAAAVVGQPWVVLGRLTAWVVAAEVGQLRTAMSR
jgi:hypothetical protein